MTPSSILKGTAVLLLLQGVSTIVLNLCGFKFPPALLAMLLLLALMLKGIIRPRTVEDVCDILIEKMGMLFLPAGVSILLYLDIIVAESTAIMHCHYSHGAYQQPADFGCDSAVFKLYVKRQRR